jgi:ketosteroid isomerase-like protein
MAATANADTIARFYEAFDACDGDAMAACYAPDARFGDPVFPDLRGEEVGAMWKMLTERATDLNVELVEHAADGDAGHARWIARYTFTQTGRRAVNDVRASFRFAGDGRIAEHRDAFSFHRWARQALGPAGLALGWTPLLRSKVQRQAAAGLAAYRSGGASAGGAGGSAGGAAGAFTNGAAGADRPRD